MDINKYIAENCGKKSDAEIGQVLGLTKDQVRHRRVKLKIAPKGIAEEEVVDIRKTGVESRMDDQVVINWSTRTIQTELGEFGSFLCSFTIHNAIQRFYVSSYEGKGHTAAEVAMKFDFAHSKAVLLYAKLHGFTKSSPGQTDIEFEEGLTPEDAADETIQSLKRRAVRLTEVKKWAAVQKDADNWNNFEQSVFYPLKDWIEEFLPKYKVPVLKASKPVEPFAVVVGITDWHYMKLAFNADGKEVYNRKIALEMLRNSRNLLANQMLVNGTPDEIIIPIGTDNLHVDNPRHETTKGTSQVSQTDGVWAMELQNYMNANIEMIDFFSQIAPVKVISIPGNHDKDTSRMLAVFMDLFYKKNDRVTVVNKNVPRVYMKYGSTVIGIGHGDDISLSKLRNNLHKFIMVEAGRQGVDIDMKIDNCLFFTGHIHTDSFVDLGGVKHFTIPSLSAEDDWHTASGYVGNKQEASIYLIGKKSGRFGIYYA